MSEADGARTVHYSCLDLRLFLFNLMIVVLRRDPTEAHVGPSETSSEVITRIQSGQANFRKSQHLFEPKSLDSLRTVAYGMTDNREPSLHFFRLIGFWTDSASFPARAPTDTELNVIGLNCTCC